MKPNLVVQIPTPDNDIPEEEKEVYNFKSSPLAKRISDDILSPIATQEILRQKKSQFNEILQKSAPRQTKKNPAFFNTCTSTFQKAKKPTIRVLSSKLKSFVPLSEEVYSNILPLCFPTVCEVFWSQQVQFGWKPETRQHASLTFCQNKLYLIGGVSRNIISDISAFNPVTKIWEKLAIIGSDSEPRFGHTAVEYNKKLFIFGGGTDFNSIHKVRECLSGVKIFDIDKKEIKALRCEGSFINTRKHHCAAILGKHLIIHGGLNQKNNFLNDSAILNLNRGKWMKIRIQDKGPGFCAFHQAAVVLNADQRHCNNIFKVPPSAEKDVQDPGIYIFGGLDEQRRASDKLYLINLGREDMHWTEPETFGQGPSARFQHSMVYNEKMNLIVIFGGRVEGTSSSFACFNDIYLLRMSDLHWIGVRVLGNIPNPRAGHCCASVATKIYIFAGGSSTYCSSDLFVLELNPKLIKQLVQEDAKRKMKEIEIEVAKRRRRSMEEITYF